MMDKKKAILIGSGILAFGVVVYFVIKKFKGNTTTTPKGNKCPDGYVPKNGKCAKLKTSTLDDGTSYHSGYEYSGYSDYGYDSGYSYDTGNTGGISGFGRNFIVSTHSGSRLRKEPNTNSTIIKTYDKGVSLLAVEDSSQSDGIWYKVQEMSGIGNDVKREGWMRSDVVDKISY